MKTIKYSLSMLIFMLYCSFFVSCSKGNSDEDIVPPYVYVSCLPELEIHDLEFGGNDIQKMYFPNYDLSNIKISSDENWCDANINYSKRYISVKVYDRGYESLEDQIYDEDPYSDRSCTVTLTDVGNNTTRSFKVVQKYLLFFYIEKTNYTILGEGGELCINFQTNLDDSYSVEQISGFSWLTITPLSTRGTISPTIILKASRNDSGEPRSATIILMCREHRVIITIKQECYNGNK